MVRPTWALDLQRGASPGNGLELAMARTRASKFTLRAVAQLQWELGSPGWSLRWGDTGCSLGLRDSAPQHCRVWAGSLSRGGGRDVVSSRRALARKPRC